MSSDEIAVILARLDERVAGLQKEIHAFHAVHSSEVERIKAEYVRLERYLHVERVVLGISAAIALGLVGLVVPKLFGGG